MIASVAKSSNQFLAQVVSITESVCMQAPYMHTGIRMTDALRSFAPLSPKPDAMDSV